MPNPWILAIRPKTLAASICPVVMGTAMAFGDGVQDWFIAVLCLIGALSIQIGTNLANDYFDFKKGTDTFERIGPVRVTQAGLIKPHVVMIGFILSFLITILVSIKLIERGGWPIAIIGITSIISGVAYTAGRYALAYLGLGEIFVLIFFGPVAVAGTYWVQSLEMNIAVILAGLAPGLLSVAILAINNLRDIETDFKSSKRTLAVRFGRSFAIQEYYYSVILAALTPILLFGIMDDHLPILASSLVLFLSVPVMITVATKMDGPSLNHALADTGRLLVFYTVIFSIGWYL